MKHTYHTRCKLVVGNEYVYSFEKIIYIVAIMLKLKPVSDLYVYISYSYVLFELYITHLLSISLTNLLHEYAVDMHLLLLSNYLICHILPSRHISLKQRRFSVDQRQDIESTLNRRCVPAGLLL